MKEKAFSCKIALVNYSDIEGMPAIQLDPDISEKNKCIACNTLTRCSYSESHVFWNNMYKIAGI